IHIHGTEDNFGLIQQYISIPTVISIQGILTSCIEKYFSGIPAAVAKKHESISDRLLLKSPHQLYKNIESRARRERSILLKTRHVIGRTNWDKRVTRILAPESSYHINNEILRNSFYTTQWNKKSF